MSRFCVKWDDNCVWSRPPSWAVWTRRRRMENADVFLGLQDFLERMRQPSAAEFVKAIKRFLWALMLFTLRSRFRFGMGTLTNEVRFSQFYRFIFEQCSWSREGQCLGSSVSCENGSGFQGSSTLGWLLWRGARKCRWSQFLLNS